MQFSTLDLFVSQEHMGGGGVRGVRQWGGDVSLHT